VLLLDEPAAGVAQREAEALGPLLAEVRDQLDAAILVIEHDLGVLGDVADRIVALDHGRVVAAGAPHSVLVDPAVTSAYLGASLGA
jgi:branched-chain amino acid transport system ATP-binding protein